MGMRVNPAKMRNKEMFVEGVQSNFGSERGTKGKGSRQIVGRKRVVLTVEIIPYIWGGGFWEPKKRYERGNGD